MTRVLAGLRNVAALLTGTAQGRRAATARPQPRLRCLDRSAVASCLFVLLAAHLLGMAPARAAASVDPVLGQTETFNVVDWATLQDMHLAATVAYVGDDVVIYAQKGRILPVDFVSGLADALDDQIYPTLTQVLGPVPDPGIDGQHRVVVVLYDFNDVHMVGAFDREDVDPLTSNPGSNRREMFTLNLGRLLTDPERAKSAAAHELAHLIMYSGDVLNDPSPNREYEGDAARWVEEGVAMYAELACGFGAGAEEQLHSFELSSNKNLTVWTEQNKDYGAGYAFMTYLVDRLGPGFVHELVAQPKDGIAGIEAVLEARGMFDTRFTPYFDDWVMADFLDGRPPAAPPYAYGALDVAVEPRADGIAPPWAGAETVQDYAAVYLDAPPIDPALVVRVVVDGEDRAPLHARLVSWDSAGLAAPTVTEVPLNFSTGGGAAGGPPGYDRHTLVVWARGAESVVRSYAVRFSLSADPEGVQFLDVGSDHRYFSYISTLVERGIVNGFEVPAASGLWYFQSDDLVKRQQFAKMVVETAGLHTEPIESLAHPAFPDVPPAYNGGLPLAYPFDYVQEAAAAGIVLGSNGLFHPGDPIARIQLVRMIVRAAAAAGHPFAPYAGAATVFADVRPGNPFYVDAMTAYANGILSGSTDAHGVTRFLPWEPATRGQVAKMTANLVNALESAP